MRHLLTTCGIFTLAAVLLGACGGDDGGGQSAGDYVKHLLSQIDKKQFGPEWDSLHPAQQAVVSRERYITCSSDARLPAIDSVDIGDTYAEAVEIPGTGTKADTTAVSLTMHLSHGLAKQNSNETFHVTKVDGQWRWMLGAESVDAYKAGRCPG